MQLTAQNAAKAQTIAQVAATDADRSNHIVEDAVLAMDKIEASARQVSQIIGVIDEIAFQTNLLALMQVSRRHEPETPTRLRCRRIRGPQPGAEVGGSGQGDQVADLGLSQQVNAGVKLVTETGQALQRIVGRIGEINGIVAVVSTSAQEQSNSLSEVNQA